MNEELIELRRSRMRRKPTKRARCEKRDEILATIAAILMVLLLFILAIVRLCTEPAYAYEMPEPVYTVDDSRPIVDYVPPQRFYDESVTDMTEAEYDELTRIVNLEAETEGLIGQQAVTEVVFNRVEDPVFPDTVHKVLSQKKQFSTWRHRSKAKVTQTQIDAIESVIREEESVLEPYIEMYKKIGTVSKTTVPKDYVYFCTEDSYYKVGIRYMRNPIVIGNHIFGTR